MRGVDEIVNSKPVYKAVNVKSLDARLKIIEAMLGVNE